MDQPQGSRRGIGRPLFLASAIALGVMSFFLWGPRAVMAPREQTPLQAQVQRLPEGTGLYDPARPVSSLRVEGKTLVPMGAPVRLPEGEMAEWKLSDEGYLVYARVVPGQSGGGGGKVPERAQGPTGSITEKGAIYLKTLDGRYQPLIEEGRPTR